MAMHIKYCSNPFVSQRSVKNQLMQIEMFESQRTPHIACVKRVPESQNEKEEY